MTEREFVVVIPARIGSGRLARKPLANICDKPMILHTYERALEATNPNNVFIATDSKEILKVCEDVGAQVIMTSRDCATGTIALQNFLRKLRLKFI